MPYKDLEAQRLRSRQYYQKHKEKCLVLSKTWRDRNPDKTKEYIKRATEKRKQKYKNDSTYRELVKKKAKLQQQLKYKKLLQLRNRIFEEHGNKCDKCGFSNPRALTIHHHFGNQKKNNYYQELKELIEKKVPISVLCANCQMILHNPKKLP